MSLIIDAYNVLHCTHVLPSQWQDVGAEGLCQMIQAAGIRRGRAYVVCDGAPPRPVLSAVDPAIRSADGHSLDFGAVDLIYAGGGKDADSLIETMVADDTAPRQLIVVSNDRRIQRAARRRKATAMGSETFLRRLGQALARDRSATPEKPVTEPDPELWLRKFGLEEDPGSPQGLEDQTQQWLREFGFIDEED